MKLTLKQKREIIDRFKMGEGLYAVTTFMDALYPNLKLKYYTVIDVIRDYMNGKFKLAAKGRR